MANMRRARRLAIGVPIAGAVLATSYVLLPYYAIAPGPAREVLPLIRIDGHPTYPSQGKLVLTSVVFDQLTALGVIWAWLDPNKEVLSRSQLFAPGETAEEERDRAISQMDRSKLDAAYVVLRELTGYPRQHGGGVLVEGIVDGCAADGELYPGDLIHSIDGAHVNTVREASAAIEVAPSGSTLTFDVTVDGEPQTIELAREPCGGEKDPLVGVSLINSFPFGIRISSGEIGGPSAGLMWALGLYDLLTPGDLTGGRTIAGTGELGIDGAVYPIGGIEEKVFAAARAGADVFLVPEGNLGEARAGGEDGVELVAVSTFDEAIEYLESAASGAR